MKISEKHLPLVTVVVVAALLLLPFLGLTEFTTKGEPREAVVTLSMLKTGDWVLPVNNGIDIPYKPPFFHYCIALVSLLAGSVSEYTSRLPSALALIALAAGCCAFYRRRVSTTVGVCGALLLLTSFEVHRAGMNCRVDMVLTAFTVGAMLLFYRWWERGSRGIPVLAVLCMSGAVLTKGPVGFVLPCFVMVVFTLLRGGRFWRTLLSYAGFALLSCLLPAVWYVAAWHEGGQHFLDLVYEENIGRMTGTMSYESHAHPFTYNFVALVTGWLPWTVLLLVSLAWRPWRKPKTGASEAGPRPSVENKTGNAGNGFAARIRKLRIKAMQIPPVRLFTWLGFLLVLFFYCLPSSKRSVYLLPCYPFMAVLMVQYVEYLWRTCRHGALRAYMIIIVVLSFLLTAVFVAVRMGIVADTLFHGKHAAENIAMLHALRDTPLDVWTFILVALPVVNGVFVLRDIIGRRLVRARRLMYFDLLSPVVLLFVALDGFYQPVVLNTKSLRPMAEYIARTFPNDRLYQYMATPMMHFFGADFYLGDTMGQFEGEEYSVVGGKVQKRTVTPASGVLVISEDDFDGFALRHTDYRFTLVSTTSRPMAEPKSCIRFYRFCRK